MIFVDQYESSVWQKVVFSISICCTTLIGVGLMFTDHLTSNTWISQAGLDGDLWRQLLLSSCLIIYFIRLQITVWVFQKRKWTWLETMIITSLMSFVVVAYAVTGGSNQQGMGLIEISGAILYVLGSYVNTQSEYRRHSWKKENKGRLYKEGLFRYASHINYGGDIVLFLGLAMIAGKISLLVIPLFMTLNFILYNIPALDSYLEQKYPDEFKEYAQKTKKLIPWIY